MHNLVLVPGLTCTRALWAPQIAALAPLAHITVGDHTRHDTVPGIATHILATAPPTFALAGLSLGGYIALEIWRQAPERVTKLALLDTSAKPFDQAQAPKRHAQVALARTQGLTPVAEQLLPAFLHPDHLKDAALVSTVRNMIITTGVAVFARQQAAIMSRPDSQLTLSTICVPTMALVGRQDALTPVAEHEAIVAGIPGSRLVVIEKCGHLSTLERPDAVNAALQAWLTG